MSFGNTVLARDGKFGKGSFRVVCGKKLKVCPPLCLPAGDYLITYGNRRGALGSRSVKLVAPTKPTLVTEKCHKAGTRQCAFLHNGGSNKNMQFTLMSPFKVPSVIPGIVELGIGANFTNYMCGPGLPGECVKDDFGVIPLSVKGQRVYFQSIVLDPKSLQFPVMTSGVTSTLYK